METSQNNYRKGPVPEPIVSVVSVYYNRSHQFLQAIESIRCQTFTAIEIIIVDDGSTDNFLNLAKSIAEQDSRIRIIAHANKGFTASIRDGVLNSKGRFVAIAGAGDLSMPDRIAKQAAFLSANPSYVAVGSHSIHENMVLGFEFVQRPQETNCLIYSYVLTHGEVMFRREAYDSVGGYREFFKYAQDRDLWFRLSRVGRLGIIPEVLVKSHAIKGGVTGDFTKKVEQLYYSNIAEQAYLGAPDSVCDIVTIHGQSAWIYRIPSRNLAKRLVGVAKLQMMARDVGGAIDTLRRSLREAIFPANATIFVGIMLLRKTGLAGIASRWLLHRERNLKNR